MMLNVISIKLIFLLITKGSIMAVKNAIEDKQINEMETLAYFILP